MKSRKPLTEIELKRLNANTAFYLDKPPRYPCNEMDYGNSSEEVNDILSSLIYNLDTRRP